MRSNGLIAILLTLFLFYNCSKDDFANNKVLDDRFFVQADGFSMPVWVQGNLASGKIILIVHGGPGQWATGFFNDRYADNCIEPYCAVAYWDQRASGLTQSNSTGKLKIEDYVKDIMRVVRVLHHNYGDSTQIYILSHSWGGLITPAFLAMDEAQKMVAGWVNVDGDSDYEYADYLSQQRMIQLSKSHLLQAKDIVEWQKILDFCNAHRSNESKEVRGKIWEYGVQAEKMLDEINNKRKLTIGFWVKEGIKTTGVSSFSYLSNRLQTKRSTLDEDVYAFKISQYLPKITTPILCLWGKHDVLVPYELGDSLLKSVSSSDKQLILLEQSGHYGMKSEPEVFWENVRIWISKR